MYNATKITASPETPSQFVKLTVFRDMASIDAIEDTLRAMPAVLDFSSDGQGVRVTFDVRCEDGAAMVPKLRKALPARGVSVLPWVAL